MALKLAILASGTGTNAQAMIDKCRQGILEVEICLIAANRPQALVLERAKKAKLPYVMLDHKKFPTREAFDQAMLEEVLKSGAEAVALAGYMRILSKEFLQGFNGPVVNLHPAILPSFPGLHGGADALAYGVKISGATVHFVDEKMDNGPVIIQAAVPVDSNDSPDALMDRIHKLEHRIYPQAIQWLATKRLSIENRLVHLAKAEVPLAKTDGSYLVYPPLEKGF